MKKLIKKPIFIIPVVIVVVIIGLIIAGNINKKPAYQISLVKKGNIIQEVSETGKIKPAESVNLAFDHGGKVAEIYVKLGDNITVGQNLVKLENSDLYAQLLQVDANLKVQQAKLEELQKGTWPEELQIAETESSGSIKNLTNVIQDSYSKAIDAVKNRIDQMFIKTEIVYQASLNSNFYNIGDFSLRADVESRRLAIEIALRQWKISLDSLSSNKNLDAFILETKTNLNLIRDFTNRMNDYFNTIDLNSLMAQNYLTTYKGYVSSANTSINAALSTLLAAEQSYKTTQDQLTFKKAGATIEQINAQKAQIESAQASILLAQAQLSKSIIKSPIDGIVAKVNASVGEIININNAAVTIISKSKFEIETNIPEADIAKVKIGNDAKITLDAYGSDVVFDAKVSEIDLDSTIIEGVPTYKTKLIFTNNDDRIISGMTANITIITATKNDVIIIPYRAITTTNGEKFVSLEISKNKTEDRKITIGLRGADGNIEVIEGLSEGDKVVIYQNGSN